MTDNGLPYLDLLKATPDILRGLMSELTQVDARWKPEPDRFSVAEVLAHLSHSESTAIAIAGELLLQGHRTVMLPVGQLKREGANDSVFDFHDLGLYFFGKRNTQ